MSHSIIPPSSAGIWGKPSGCTGWVLMSQSYPEDEESEASKEGTAAHEIAEKMVVANSRGRVGYPTKNHIVGSTASNGVVWTEDMYSGAELYANDVREVMEASNVFGGENLGVENQVRAPLIHELSYGTPDCYLYDSRQNVLYIWDFKYGHRVVEAYENWQAICYACGIVHKLKLSPFVGGIDIKVRIVQPRAFHRDGVVREWSFSGSRLEGYQNTLKDNASIALGPNATFQSGPHCRDCPGRHACPAALEAGVQLYEVSTKYAPVDLGSDATATQYSIIKRALNQLECLKTAFEEDLKNRIRRGENIKGYRAEEKLGRKEWSVPVEDVFSIGDSFGKDLRKISAKTPTQAIKLGIDEDVVNTHSQRRISGFSLVEDDLTAARQIFGN